MSRNKGLAEQDLTKLDVTTLHPLSPEVISRQATINIGTIGHVAHGKSTVVKGICGVQMPCEEVLKNVFPLLEGEDLAACMVVCKQWRDIASDDFYWKCQCAKRWPSVCKRTRPPTETYYKMYQRFGTRLVTRIRPPSRLSFEHLEFFIDIWSDDELVLSGIIPGVAFERGIKTLPSGIRYWLRSYLDSPDYKMVFPAEPRFTILPDASVSVSLLVARNDSDKVARIVNRSFFEFFDASEQRAFASEDLDLSPDYPFISSTQAWISLFFTYEEGRNIVDTPIDVFGIELDFNGVADTKEEVLWLLDMLNWK